MLVGAENSGRSRARASKRGTRFILATRSTLTFGRWPDVALLRMRSAHQVDFELFSVNKSAQIGGYGALRPSGEVELKDLFGSASLRWLSGAFRTLPCDDRMERC